jgi:hypothetical protein
MGPVISPAAVETSEWQTIYSCVANLDSDLRRRVGMTSLLVGGGLALSVRDDSAHVWTRALGSGFTQPVTRDLIRQLTDFYQEQASPVAAIQLAPSVIPADWDQICAEAELSAGPKWVKLAAETDVVVAKVRPDLPGDLRLATVAPDEAIGWAGTMAQILEAPDEWYTTMIASLAGQPSCYTYAVWAGDQIIATAGMRLYQDTAQRFGAATVQEYRAAACRRH